MIGAAGVHRDGGCVQSLGAGIHIEAGDPRVARHPSKRLVEVVLRIGRKSGDYRHGWRRQSDVERGSPKITYELPTSRYC